MISEIAGKDVNETKPPHTENYKNIKPEKELSVKELNDAVFEEVGRAFGDIPESESKTASESPRYIITRNESLEGDRHPITGVPFERRIVEGADGEKIEGVFPKFDSQFDAKLPQELYLDTDKAQFKECNRQLSEAIDKAPELKSKFTPEQIEQIREGVSDGTAPDGYVWNHDAEAGKMQLVDFETHAKTGHTGGRSIWGGGSDNR